MKERLTGAIILVVLIVLLVPELLSGPKGSATPPAAVAPTSSEEPPLRSYTINLGDDSHARTSALGASGPSMPQPSGPEQLSTPDPAGSSPPTVDSSTASQPTSPARSVASAQPTSPESSKPDANPATPPPPHSLALAPKGAPIAKPPPPVAKAVHPASKASAPPEKAIPAEKTAATSGTGWAVQLGVFASHENAERLALEVRSKGFKASVSPVTSGGRKLYRVRVGPTPDRSAAQELQAKLKAAGRPGGTVVPYS